MRIGAQPHLRNPIQSTATPVSSGLRWEMLSYLSVGKLCQVPPGSAACITTILVW